MQAAWTSAIAVLGTLLGAALTYVLQRRSLDRTQLEARRERARKELVEAFNAFASATMALGNAEKDRWSHRMRSPTDEEPVEVRREADRLRSEAWNTYFRVRLLADPARDDRLLGQVSRAINLASDVSKDNAVDGEHMRGTGVRAAIEDAIDVAGSLLREQL